MLSSRFKTSTRTALIFTFFASILLFAFIVMLNVYYFYNWRLDEKNEMINKTEVLALHTIGPVNGTGVISEARMRQFFQKILEQGGMIQTGSGEIFMSPKWDKNTPNSLDLYKEKEYWYIRYTFPFREMGTIGLPYDITEHIQGQLSLLRISAFLGIIFFIIIALVSLFFTRSSLRPLSKIIHYIRSFRVDSPLPFFPLTGPKDDEFVIVAETLSEAFKKIQTQTEALQQFSSDAAHEFKTPLMVIRSEIDYALKSGAHKEGLESIGVQVRLLDAMITTLLTITRIEREDIQKEEVNISELLEEILSETEHIFHEKNLKIIRHIEKGVVLISNRSMLQIIFSNLISNAFKYTDSGEIHITLTKKEFSVRDTGMGISEKNIHKIWDRLFREDSSRSENEGHGLGLFLVKTIIDKLGYIIDVTSKKGSGSTFSVRFEAPIPSLFYKNEGGKL